MQGKFAEAITQGEKALRLNPRFAPVYYHLAFALAKQGNFSESIKKYQDLIELTPEKSGDIYNQIGKIYVHLGRLTEAEGFFRQAIDHSESKKSIADVHFNLGYVLKRLNKPEEAARELQKAIEGYGRQLKENPGSSETHVVLAKALAEYGDYEQATKHLFQARDLDPTNFNRHRDLIRVLEMQGRFDEAIEASRRGIHFMLNSNQKEAATSLRAYLQSLEARKSQKY
jgi:tetratricopeptide (TPR) repeat protein